jgi:IS30 family transposase
MGLIGLSFMLGCHLLSNVMISIVKLRTLLYSTPKQKSSHQGVIVTYVDKTSKYLLAGLVNNKTVEQVNQLTIKLFAEVKQSFRSTITFDNGREFCGHQEIATILGLDVFFANPYHSWERGLNEHTNGLIRRLRGVLTP